MTGEWTDRGPGPGAEYGFVDPKFLWYLESLGETLTAETPVTAVTSMNTAAANRIPDLNLNDHGVFEPATVNSLRELAQGTLHRAVVRFRTRVGDVNSILTTLGSANGHVELYGITTPFRMPTAGRTEIEPGSITVGADTPIVAVIDDGLAFANMAFRTTPTQTRVQAFVDIRSTGDPRQPLAARQIWKSTIDDLLTDHSSEQRIYDSLDLFYRKGHASSPFEVIRAPLARRVSHGAHVLDVACGATPAAGSGDDTKPGIIALNLPPDVVDDRSGRNMADALSMALDELLDIAAVLEFPPLVVNFSFGVFAGPHDGTGLIERQLQDLIRNYPDQRCTVVMPAGNSFQARAVVRCDAKAGQARSIDWAVLPDDRSSSMLEIQSGPRRPSDPPLEVFLQPPAPGFAGTGETSALHIVDLIDTDPDGNMIWARLHHRVVPADRVGFVRDYVTVFLSPTADGESGAPRLPSGRWKVNMVPGIDTWIEGRVQRDDAPRGAYARGRQSHLKDPDYPRFEHPSGRIVNDTADRGGLISRARTLNAFATASDLIVVGGVRRSDGRAAVYSSAGGTNNPNRIYAPDVAAIVDESSVHRGVLASGVYSGSTASVSGTSVAAPMLTRLIAQALAEGQTAEDVLVEIERDETCGAPIGRTPPVQENADRIGRGRLRPAPPPPHRQRVFD